MQSEPQHSHNTEDEAAEGTPNSKGLTPASVRQRLVVWSAARPVLACLLAYTAAWLGTALIGYALWGDSLPRASLALLLLGFFLPCCLVGAAVSWTTRGGSMGRVVQVCLFLGMLLALLNIFVIHFPLKSYGDSAALSTHVLKDSVQAHWLLGASIVNRFYQSIIHPLGRYHLLPPSLNANSYVRALGSIVMAVSSILLVARHPNRLSTLLPMTTPIWILFASGYNEYYPFVAPAFLGLLVLLTERDLRSTPPWAIALLASSLGLLYAGFVPIAILLLLGYAAQHGLRPAVRAAILSGVFALVLVIIFWPTTMLTFIKNYVYEMNLGEQNTLYPQYVGKALASTPFFSPAYALSMEHLGHLFFMFFWAGGLSPLLLAVAAPRLANHRPFAFLKRPSHSFDRDHVPLPTQLLRSHDCKDRADR